MEALDGVMSQTCCEEDAELSPLDTKLQLNWGSRSPRWSSLHSIISIEIRLPSDSAATPASYCASSSAYFA
jgi:hypothetical protein